MAGDLDQPQNQAHIEALATFFNGNARALRVQHVELGCCANRKETIEKMAGAFEAGILAHIGPEDVSKHRWGLAPTFWGSRSDCTCFTTSSIAL